MNSVNIERSAFVDGHSILYLGKIMTDFVLFPLKRIYTLKQMDRLFSTRLSLHNFDASGTSVYRKVSSLQTMTGLWKGFGISVFNYASFIFLGLKFFDLVRFLREKRDNASLMNFAFDDNSTKSVAAVPKDYFLSDSLLFIAFFNTFQFCFFPLEKLRMSMMMDMTNTIETNKV